MAKTDDLAGQCHQAVPAWIAMMRSAAMDSLTEDDVKEIVQKGNDAGKDAGYQLTFFEHLQGRILIENCQRDVFHYDRFIGAAEGHDEGLA